jgi:hypothetical protein
MGPILLLLFWTTTINEGKDTVLPCHTRGTPRDSFFSGDNIAEDTEAVHRKPSSQLD